MQNSSRRKAIKTLAGSALSLSAMDALAESLHTATNPLALTLKGRIEHSVCRWCYSKISLDDLCKAAKDIGMQSVELTNAEEWPTVKKYGLTSGMVYAGSTSIDKGFNDLTLHDNLVASYEAGFVKAKDAGMKQVICFSGNRRPDLNDEQGLENSAKGLKRLMASAEKNGIVMVMELLNSKVNHKNYMADHTAWGVELCKRVGSENFKLLYDIYHMQIMEGDLIRTIKDNNKYLAHYHTGGNPGRNEIDETQEIYYPAVVQAIIDTGYKGYLGQEFIPKRDPITSLRQAVQLCDV